MYTFSDLIEGGYLYVDKTAQDIFIFEFKLRDTAEAAMRQIRERRYAEPYLSDSRPVTLVGVAFTAKERNIASSRPRPRT